MLLDYRVLFDIVARTVQAGPIDFLEGLALAVAERTMDSGSVTSVRVAVRKPHVPLPGPLDYAEVSVELTRNDD
jgi:dihydroneopterin aldolase